MRQLKIEDRVTNRSRTIDRYFSEINTKKRISIEEEVALANRIRQGDERAVDALVEANLRFVVSVAKQYAGDPETLADLISHGNLGLIEAARKFDPTLGFKFISYAVWFIRKEIMLYFGTSKRTIKLPIKAEQDLRRIKRAEVVLEMRLERKPTVDEIATELADTGESLKIEKIETLLKEEKITVPLEGADEDDEFSPIRWLTIEDEQLTQIENSTDSSVKKRLIREMLSSLNGLERKVVRQALALDGGEPISYTTISENLGKPSGWARNTYLAAIRKMFKRYKKLTSSNEKIPDLF